MTRNSNHSDRVIDLGLAFLLVFTPLAFGAVEEWAKAIAQFVIVVIFGTWVLQVVWGGRRTPPPADGQRSILGGRVLLSGLELPALLFVLVVVAQLVPLPPGVLRAVSPATADLYARSLPGYGESSRPSFAGLPAWLQQDERPEAGGVPALPPDPDAASRAVPPEVFDVAYPAWRPLSLTPAHTRRALEIFLGYLAVLVVAYNHLGRRERSRRFLYELAALCALLAVIGILQNLSGSDKLYWLRGGHTNLSFGPFANANNFAGWMEMALPVTAGLAAWAWIEERRRSASMRGLSSSGGRQGAFIVLVFATVIGLAALVVSKSRGGSLAFAGACAVLGLTLAATGRLRFRLVAAVLAVVIVALGASAWLDWEEVRERYASLGDVAGEPSFRDRLSFSRHTLAIAADFPVLGTGFGTFPEAYGLYSPGTSHLDLKRAHNDYAQILAECGIAGGVAVVWALIVLLFRAVRPGLARDGSAFRWVVRGAAVGVLALLIHSFVDFNLQIYSNGLLFVFLCAFLMRDAANVRARSRAGGA